MKVSCIDLEPWSCLQHMYVATQRSGYMATHQYVALSVVLFRVCIICEPASQRVMRVNMRAMRVNKRAMRVNKGAMRVSIKKTLFLT